jgi:hypothetical protein
MAVAVAFPEANRVFTHPECYNLHSWDGTAPVGNEPDWPLKISCWQLSEEELTELQKNGGKLWLMQYSTHQPPVNIQVQSPFEPTEEQSQDMHDNG